ncbi:hypothetical protein CRYUN_Cryun32bG0026100 [Craigia yunnanensis]
MNPKIADFGMAKLFKYDQTHTDTTRVVGTFGYMAPEYVKRGHFSIKSDVYSFGVLVLEIIIGMELEERNRLECNRSYYQGDSRSEMMKCIHLGLLCIQEDVANRPTMASVVLTLSRCTYSVPEPSKPGFFLNSSPASGESSLQNVVQFELQGSAGASAQSLDQNKDDQGKVMTILQRNRAALSFHFF